MLKSSDRLSPAVKVASEGGTLAAIAPAPSQDQLVCSTAKKFGIAVTRRSSFRAAEALMIFSNQPIRCVPFGIGGYGRVAAFLMVGPARVCVRRRVRRGCNQKLDRRGQVEEDEEQQASIHRPGSDHRLISEVGAGFV